MKIDDKTSHNSPSLRFPEFNGEWEKCKLGTLATKVGSGSTPKGGDAVYTSIGHYFVRSQNVGMGFLMLDNIAHINDDIHQKHKATEIYENDVLLNITGASIGRTAVATKELEGGNVNQHVCIIRTNSKVNPKFLCDYIQTQRIQNHIKSLQTGGSREGLNFEQIRSFPISLPSINEQNKLTCLLDKINERIATQVRLIEDLKKLKSAISKELFSNHLMFDKKVPLSDFCSMKNGYAFKSSSYEVDGIYNIVTIANVTGDRYISSDCNKVANMPNDIQIHQHLCVNDILVSLTGNVGRVSLCREGYYLLNQRVGLLDVSKTICKEFIYQILSTKHFENEMIAKAQGAAQMNISKSDVESYLIPYTTNLNVINKVASLLNAYDSQILMGEQLLLDLTRQKQYMLRQMFI